MTLKIKVARIAAVGKKQMETHSKLKNAWKRKVTAFQNPIAAPLLSQA
jgi:hypothetical protein